MTIDDDEEGRHTSVEVWNREIFYGAGIMETLPGRSHVSTDNLPSHLPTISQKDTRKVDPLPYPRNLSQHGQPLHVIPCGPTEIPEEVFDDYLADLKSRYTSGNYHLLEFNCNSFTQDVSGDDR